MGFAYKGRAVDLKQVEHDLGSALCAQRQLTKCRRQLAHHGPTGRARNPFTFTWPWSLLTANRDS
jgi:hypothetical protein